MPDILGDAIWEIEGSSFGNQNQSNIVPFKIDSVEFDQPDTAAEGTWENDARFITICEGPQSYEVAIQPVPGFKSITQATEPEALKYLHVIAYTFTKDDRDFMDGLNNYQPHAIQCPFFTESPILMYLQQKTPRIFRTGLQKFAIEWDMKWVEVNDNN